MTTENRSKNPVTFDVLQRIIPENVAEKPLSCLKIEDIRNESSFLGVLLESKLADPKYSAEHIKGAVCSVCILKSALKKRGESIVIFEGEEAKKKAEECKETFTPGQVIGDAQKLVKKFPIECRPESEIPCQHYLVGVGSVLSIFYKRGAITALPKQKPKHFVMASFMNNLLKSH